MHSTHRTPIAVPASNAALGNVSSSAHASAKQAICQLGFELAENSRLNFRDRTTNHSRDAMDSTNSSTVFERVLIRGNGGSGKTRLARRIGEQLRHTIIHLDEILLGAGPIRDCSATER